MSENDILTDIGLLIGLRETRDLTDEETDELCQLYAQLDEVRGN